MIYLMIAAAIAGWTVIAAWLVTMTTDNATPANLGILCVFFVLSLAGLMSLTAENKSVGPCMQYETRMMYNAATKTMMPAKFCVLRGEWAEE